MSEEVETSQRGPQYPKSKLSAKQIFCIDAGLKIQQLRAQRREEAKTLRGFEALQLHRNGAATIRGKS